MNAKPEVDESQLSGFLIVFSAGYFRQVRVRFQFIFKKIGVSRID